MVNIIIHIFEKKYSIKLTLARKKIKYILI